MKVRLSNAASRLANHPITPAFPLKSPGIYGIYSKIYVIGVIAKNMTIYRKGLP